MSIRVHDLAKRCGLSNKEMIEKLHTMNYPVKSHSSTVDKITAASLENEYGYVPPPVPVPEPPKPAEPAVAPAVAKVEAPAATATLELPAPSPQKLATPAPVTPLARPVQVVVAPPRPQIAAKPVVPQPTVTPPPAPVIAPMPVAQTVKPVARPLPPLPSKIAAKPALTKPAVAEPNFIIDDHGNKVIQMKPPVVVRDLAMRLSVKPHLLLMELMELNVFANLNETLGEEA